MEKIWRRNILNNKQLVPNDGENLESFWKKFIIIFYFAR